MSKINDEKQMKRKQEMKEKFTELCGAPIEDQVQLFLKSFIFALGDEWKEVLKLSNEFQKYCREGGENRMDLNPVQAANFLQKYGLTRTASQRNAEIKDVDLNSDNRISFIEYLLLHYKIMILNEYYQRLERAPEEDLSNGGIGLTGVGEKLIDELFTIKVGLDPEVERAIEEFTAMKKDKEKKIADLTAKAAAGGVKGLAAKNELEQMERADNTDGNRLEITLNAAKRRAGKENGALALEKKKKEEEELAKQKALESKRKLAERAALFEKKAAE